MYEYMYSTVYMLYYVSCIHVSVVFDENNLLFFGFLV
jgi:hypothetical protein